MKDIHFDIEKIKHIANQFKTYEEMYDLLVSGDHSFLLREYGTNNYPQLRWMIEHFTEKEEYEKCSFLLDLKEKLRNE